VIRDNKKQEVIKQILADSDLDLSRKLMRDKAKLVIKSGKAFSKIQKRLEEIADQRREK